VASEAPRGVFRAEDDGVFPQAVVSRAVEGEEPFLKESISSYFKKL
jgi:hypothetical protein